VALVDVATFLIAAAALAILHVDEVLPARTQSAWLLEAGAGLRHIGRVPALRRTTTAFGICMLAMGSVDTMLFAYVEGLHRPPEFLGVLVTVQGAGVLLGALLAGRVMTRLGEVALCAIGILTFGIAIGLAVCPSVGVAFLAMPFAGLGNTVVGIAFGTLLQRRTPGPLIGRVSAAADMAISGAAALSMAVGATLVAFVDYRVVFAVDSAALLSTAGGLWLADHRRTVAEPLPPAAIRP
jgi:MFS family permease